MVMLVKTKDCLVKARYSFRRECGRTPPSPMYWHGCAKDFLCNDFKDETISLRYAH